MSELVIHFLPSLALSLSKVALGAFLTDAGLYFSMEKATASPMSNLRNTSAMPPLAFLIDFVILYYVLVLERRQESNPLQGQPQGIGRPFPNYATHRSEFIYMKALAAKARTCAYMVVTRSICHGRTRLNPPSVFFGISTDGYLLS